MKLPQIFLTGKGTGSIEVNDSIFAAPVNMDLIAQALYVYQSNQRHAHATVQRRGDVKRTTAKWYKQKGTGRARHGARSAPIFVGGGQAHGPTGEQNYKKTLPQQMRMAAVRAALSAMVQAEKAMIGQGAEKLAGQAKELKALLPQFKLATNENLLVILGDGQENVLRAARNFPQISLTRAQRVTALDLAQADAVLVLNEALEILEKRLLRQSKKAAAVTEAAPKKTRSTKPSAAKAPKGAKKTEDKE